MNTRIEIRAGTDHLLFTSSLLLIFRYNLCVVRNDIMPQLEYYAFTSLFFLENLKKDMDLILGNLLNWRKERIDGEGLGFPLFLAKILMGRRLKSYK